MWQASPWCQVSITKARELILIKDRKQLSDETAACITTEIGKPAVVILVRIDVAIKGPDSSANGFQGWRGFWASRTNWLEDHTTAKLRVGCCIQSCRSQGTDALDFIYANVATTPGYSYMRTSSQSFRYRFAGCYMQDNPYAINAACSHWLVACAFIFRTCRI